MADRLTDAHRIAQAIETALHREYGPLNTPGEDALFDRMAEATLAALPREDEPSGDCTSILLDLIRSYCKSIGGIPPGLQTKLVVGACMDEDCPILLTERSAKAILAYDEAAGLIPSREDEGLREPERDGYCWRPEICKAASLCCSYIDGRGLCHNAPDDRRESRLTTALAASPVASRPENLERAPSDDAVVPRDARKQGAPGLNGPSGSPTHRLSDAESAAVQSLAGTAPLSVCLGIWLAAREFYASPVASREDEGRSGITIRKDEVGRAIGLLAGAGIEVAAASPVASREGANDGA